MIRALRSSLFRFFKTGLFVKVLIFSIVMPLLVITRTAMDDLNLLPFQQPRYINNEFILLNLATLVYVIPFASAIFTSIFTGNDVQSRAINNKIATGISRTQIFLSDFILSIIVTEISLVMFVIVFFIYGKYAPVKGNVSLNGYMIHVIVCIMIICAAFTAVYTLLQFFSNNKLLGLVLAILIIPALLFSNEYINDKLNEPYRVYCVDEDKGGYWMENGEYIGGFPRTALTFIYNTSPYTFKYLEKEKTTVYMEAEAAGAVVLVSVVSGIACIKKKEYP